MNRKTTIPLFFLFILSLIYPVYASEGENVNIMQLPEKLSEALGIPVFASQLLLCSIFLFMFLLPLAIWGKTSLPVIIVGFSVMGTLIALGWLPYWFLLIISLIVALIYAKEIKNLLTGGA